MENLESERIILRPIDKSDTPNILRWRNSSFVMSHFIMRTPLTEKMHEGWLQNKVKTGSVIQFIINDKGNGEDIGSVYFRDIDYELKTAEFGIFLGEERYAGRGYGSEATKLSLDYITKVKDLRTVSLRLLKDNERAHKAYEKCGFRLLDKEERVITPDGTVLDIIFMEYNVDEENS